MIRRTKTSRCTRKEKKTIYANATRQSIKNAKSNASDSKFIHLLHVSRSTDICKKVPSCHTLLALGLWQNPNHPGVCTVSSYLRLLLEYTSSPPRPFSAHSAAIQSRKPRPPRLAPPLHPNRPPRNIQNYLVSDQQHRQQQQFSHTCEKPPTRPSDISPPWPPPKSPNPPSAYVTHPLPHHPSSSSVPNQRPSLMQLQSPPAPQTNPLKPNNTPKARSTPRNSPQIPSPNSTPGSPTPSAKKSTSPKP